MCDAGVGVWGVAGGETDLRDETVKDQEGSVIKEVGRVESVDVGVPGSGESDVPAPSKPPRHPPSSLVFPPLPSESPSPAYPLSPETSIYQIKWIILGEDEQHAPVSLPIVMQNKNGPCPLISLANVLLLTRRLQLQPGIEYQSGENLMAQLASLILESIPRTASEEELRNYEQNVQDALAILPKLQTGLDINVRFAGPRQYEFTQDTLVFDVLDVPLVHGWIVDSNDPAKTVIDKCGSYNHLVEYIINAKQTPTEHVEEVLHAEDWLERTGGQLTYAGLIALVECLTPNALYVLFRNNHFSTIVKHKDQIYALVTDQGYAGEASCVWEQISNIEGDTDFFDAKFQLRTVVKEPLSPTASQQMDVDLQLALSLQEQEDAVAAAATALPTAPTDLPVEEAGSESLSDYELAQRLQAEEERMVQHRVKVPRNSDTYPPGKMMSVLPESQSAQTFLDHDRDPRHPHHHRDTRPRGLPTSASTLGGPAPPSPAPHPGAHHHPEPHPSARALPLRRGHSAAADSGGESKAKNCVIS
ncbi:ubiquitin carboxyl-terminal hydrolase MINDY-1-like [Paramacrobiotus metropolitanus]|uniref:ubiquitin carboxyl-terminal hydrolase MINDY-1-like n=1 Tax=Paramacrobiotus metropolitanus TaxID=2943436 RepID=UPI002445D91C|nr:ubiquitin carboxyl-terminal hydrolase MINDY-1-like [Paramacrobiotus metropolitanus]